MSGEAGGGPLAGEAAGSDSDSEQSQPPPIADTEALWAELAPLEGGSGRNKKDSDSSSLSAVSEQSCEGPYPPLEPLVTGAKAPSPASSEQSHVPGPEGDLNRFEIHSVSDDSEQSLVLPRRKPEPVHRTATPPRGPPWPAQDANLGAHYMPHHPPYTAGSAPPAHMYSPPYWGPPPSVGGAGRYMGHSYYSYPGVPQMVIHRNLTTGEAENAADRKSDKEHLNLSFEELFFEHESTATLPQVYEKMGVFFKYTKLIVYNSLVFTIGVILLFFWAVCSAVVSFVGTWMWNPFVKVASVLVNPLVSLLAEPLRVFLGPLVDVIARVFSQIRVRFSESSKFVTNPDIEVGRGTQHCPARVDLQVDQARFDRARWNDQQQSMEANTKPCPKCHTPIEKNGLCTHMTCPIAHCRFEWCWICGIEWNRQCQHDHWFG